MTFAWIKDADVGTIEPARHRRGGFLQRERSLKDRVGRADANECENCRPGQTHVVRSSHNSGEPSPGGFILLP